MNRVTIIFKECDPAPPKGYKVYWRIGGSGPLTLLGNFFSSPITFLDDSPPGTQYEGTITSAYNNVQCSNILWSTSGGGGGSGGSGSGGIVGNPIFATREAMVEENICSNLPEALFLNQPYLAIQPGAYLYYDAALTMPVVGFMWVKDDSGVVFNLDIDDGRVLSPTGNAC